MMATRTQRKLEFQVRKSTRLTRSTAGKTVKEDVLLKPISVSVKPCEPPKRKQLSVPNTGSVSKSEFKRNTRSQSPVFKCDDQTQLNSVCVTPSKTFRTVDRLSPRKRPSSEAIAPSTPSKSPRKEVRTILKSPRKELRSPRKENVPSPIKKVLESKEAIVSPLRLFKQDGQCYNDVKKVFHTARPERIVCREKEKEQIDSFLQTHLVGKRPGSMYVSGAPGTGKTAVLSHLLEKYRTKCKCKSIFVNCMNSRSSTAIFNKVATEMQGKTFQKSSKEAVKYLEKSFTSNGPMVLLILDEIDQLDSKNQEVLYTMFEWPALAKSRLVLIGIANALDLTDRILPRLQARPKCKPQLLNFPPYSKDQIVKVLEDRLKEISKDSDVMLEPAALQFCARKVSAIAGDMRKALDVCRRAVEVVEARTKKQKVLKPTVCNSPRKSPRKTPSTTMKKIGVADIAGVVSEVYGSRMTSSTQQQQTFPLQQKLVVCTLLMLVKRGRTKEITIGKLHEAYTKICKKRQMTAAEQSEFLNICSLIETRGIMTVKKNKESRMSKVTLKLDEKELEFALQDKTLLSSILADGLA